MLLKKRAAPKNVRFRTLWHTQSNMKTVIEANSAASRFRVWTQRTEMISFLKSHPAYVHGLFHGHILQFKHRRFASLTPLRLHLASRSHNFLNLDVQSPDYLAALVRLLRELAAS